MFTSQPSEQFMIFVFNSILFPLCNFITFLWALSRASPHRYRWFREGRMGCAVLKELWINEFEICRIFFMHFVFLKREKARQKRVKSSPVICCAAVFCLRSTWNCEKWWMRRGSKNLRKYVFRAEWKNNVFDEFTHSIVVCIICVKHINGILIAMQNHFIHFWNERK